jgi:hypothetical protein
MNTCKDNLLEDLRIQYNILESAYNDLIIASRDKISELGRRNTVLSELIEEFELSWLIEPELHYSLQYVKMPYQINK